MAQDPEQRASILVRSGFDQLGWAQALTVQERLDLEAWADTMPPDAYAGWYYWASHSEPWDIYSIMRAPIEEDPRRTPPRVETRAMRRRRTALQQEPDIVYRIRTSMEVQLPKMVAQEAEDAAWWEDWERRHPVEMETIRRRDAEIEEECRREAREEAEAREAQIAAEQRREERRQRAAKAQADFERHHARAQEAWARMRRYQAEVQEDEEARERAGESSGSN